MTMELEMRATSFSFEITLELIASRFRLKQKKQEQQKSRKQRQLLNLNRKTNFGWSQTNTRTHAHVTITCQRGQLLIDVTNFHTTVSSVFSITKAANEKKWMNKTQQTKKNQLLIDLQHSSDELELFTFLVIFEFVANDEVIRIKACKSHVFTQLTLP